MSTTVNELYSLLIPLADRRLLVPRACVAEVVGLTDQDAADDDLPWSLGAIRWNGRQVSVVSFEACCGEAVPELGRRSRIVIFQALGGVIPSGYFGIVSQGFPQLVRVSPNVLKSDDEATSDSSKPVLCRVRMANEFPLIPDLDMLEDKIAASAATDQ